MAIYYVNMMDKFAEIIDKVQTLEDIKHTKKSVDDTCVLLRSMLEQLRKDFLEFTNETRQRHEKELNRNLAYFEKIEIEYSTEVDFSEIYQYKAVEDVCMTTAASGEGQFSGDELPSGENGGVEDKVEIDLASFRFADIASCLGYVIITAG